MVLCGSLCSGLAMWAAYLHRSLSALEVHSALDFFPISRWRRTRVIGGLGTLGWPTRDHVFFLVAVRWAFPQLRIEPLGQLSVSRGC